MNFASPDSTGRQVPVLCIGNDAGIAETIRGRISRGGTLAWIGWLPRADDLVEYVKRMDPRLVVLDLEMPGLDSAGALAALNKLCPRSRVVALSGRVAAETIEQVLESGAWGFVAKGDGDEELMRSLERVSEGEISLSPHARRIYESLEANS